MQITVRLDDRELQRNLRALGPKMDAVMAKSLNRTAFEVLEAEKAHVAQTFKFAGPSTRSFMSGRGSFRFDAAHPGKLEVAIMPAPRNEQLLEEHERGGQIGLEAGPRLALRGELLVPIKAKRGARGRVPKRDLPSTVLAPGGKGFVAKGVVFARRGRGGREVVALYAITPKITLPARLEFFNTARQSVQRWFVTKAREEFAKSVR